MKIFIALIFISITFLSSKVSANTPVCSSASGGYCQYSGKVNRIYINSGNIILIYFERALDVAEAEAVGMNISNGGAAAFKVSNNPEFAQMFYSTALTAQASGRDVSIQMRGVESGYMAFDRIWLSAP